MTKKKNRIDRFDGANAFLSNFWAKNPFLWNGDVFVTGEHAFQAAKAKDPLDYFRIRDSATPGAAKRLGRKVVLAANWDKKKLDVMEAVLMAKFNPIAQGEMAQKLVNTGDAQLVEGNTWGDVYWGVDATSGVGQNHLGKLLMLVRARIAGAETMRAGLEGLV